MIILPLKHPFPPDKYLSFSSSSSCYSPLFHLTIFLLFLSLPDASIIADEHAWMSTGRERSDETSKRIKREGDVVDRLGRRHLLGPPGTLNTITPCAACKLLRRRCAQECPFSPYFSPHDPQKFASVHKVFGASNVSKLLMEVPEQQRADAANSLVYEANVRLRDPVYGCMGAISALQQQVQSLETELTLVRAEILKHKFGHSSSTNVLSTSHAGLLINVSGGVSVATSPPIHSAPPPVIPVIPVPSASSSSSMYTPTPPPSSSTAYSSITNDNVSYFG